VRFRSLFFKLFISFLLATVANLAVFSLIRWLAEAELLPVSSTRGAFSEALSLYSEAAIQAYKTQGLAGLQQFVGRSQRESGAEIYLFTDNLKLIDARPVPDSVSVVAREIAGQQQPGQRIARVFGGRVTWGKITIAPDGERFIFVVRFFLPSMRPPPPWQLSTSRIAGLVLTTGLVCYLLALYLTSPVKKLQSTVKAFAEGNLDARVSPGLGSRRDELADLGREFDHMAERISSLISSQKRLLADISHELRSPLARLSVALELARKSSNGKAAGPLDRIEQESERVNQLVGQLLALTRLESGAERVPPEVVSLEDLAQQIIDDADFEAKPLHREVRAVQLDHCRVKGSPELLRSAIENVVRNAVRYTAEGTAVEVSLISRLDAAVLKVRDHGPGIPESDLQHIFEPFYRVSEARERASGGAGLGLSIADRTVKLHGGAIRAENAADGLVVTIELPLAPAAAPVHPAPEKLQV